VAGVRRILDGIGRPEDVVAGTGVSVPQPREPRPVEETPEGGARPASPTAASPPHLAPAGELGPRESDPDWWRGGPGGPRYAPGGQRPVGGFVGGIELPEMLDRPPDPDPEKARARAEAEARARAERAAAEEGVAGELPVAFRRKRWVRLRRPRTARAAKAAGAGRVPRAGGVVELLAAALLVAGAIAGSLIPLGLGWLVAWWSPRLSRREARRAVTVVPGAVAAAGLVWLWGRTEGRWGEPIARGALGDEITAAWPWALRAAAVASALYLLWRARRPKG
jgi:hypothetical protein